MSAVLPSPAGRIGPNAITRVAEALPGFVGTEAARALFERAGLAAYFTRPPQDMVDEAEVARLHGELRRALGPERAAGVARSAGIRTADYLLAHRIPRAVQALLKRLPAALAARVLLAAIARHAWTFAGSGRFSARAPALAGAGARCAVLEIRDNPLCRDLQAEAPACDFYAATFERLFQVLVQPRTRVRETACEACGDESCRFELRW